MTFARTNDGVDLYYESTGSGVPIVFVHEFAGDLRSWEQQVRHFGSRYRTLTFNARGYPPSAVPPDVASYSQNRAVADIVAGRLLEHGPPEEVIPRLTITGGYDLVVLGGKRFSGRYERWTSRDLPGRLDGKFTVPVLLARV